MPSTTVSTDPLVLSPGPEALRARSVEDAVAALQTLAESGRGARTAWRRVPVRVPPGTAPDAPEVRGWLRALDEAAPWCLWFLTPEPAPGFVGSPDLLRAVLDVSGAGRAAEALRRAVELAGFSADRGLDVESEIRRVFEEFQPGGDAEAFFAKVRGAWREWDDARGLPFEPREVDNASLNACFGDGATVLHVPTRGTGAARFLARVPDPYHAFFGHYDLVPEPTDAGDEVVLRLRIDMGGRDGFAGAYRFRLEDDRERRELEQLVLQPHFETTVLGNRADGVLVTCFTRRTRWEDEPLSALKMALDAWRTGRLADAGAPVETSPGGPAAADATDAPEAGEVRRAATPSSPPTPVAVRVELGTGPGPTASSGERQTLVPVDSPAAGRASSLRPEPPPPVVAPPAPPRRGEEDDAVESLRREVDALLQRARWSEEDALDGRVRAVEEALAASRAEVDRALAHATARSEAAEAEAARVRELLERGGPSGLEQRVLALERETRYLRELAERRIAQAEQRLGDAEGELVRLAGALEGAQASGGLGGHLDRRPWWRFW
ncbi:hypothetical protein L6R50_26405 [Myxococcota bacterium]|nr:hypothetical protein [Myxococcota bacterium]